MNIRTKGAFLGLAFLVAFLYVGVQLNFINYYDRFGIPFGKQDVDNYLISINNGSYIGPDDMLVIHMSRVLSSIITPELLLTWMVPLFLCVFLPLTVFMLGFWMSRDGTVALVSTVVFVFGTIVLQAFGISALWSQMISTVFFVWAVIFSEEYFRNKASLMGNLAAIMAALSVFAHLKAAGIFLIYIAIRFSLTHRKNALNTIPILFVMLAAIIYCIITPSYPYTVDVWYVFTHFMYPLLWILAFFGLLKGLVSKQHSLVVISSMVFMIMGISSISVLWRPLLSALPFLAVFATIEIFEILDRQRPVVSMIIILSLCLVLMAYSYDLTGMALTSMYQEMIPGFFNDTVRNVNGTLFDSIWVSGGKI